MDAANLSGDVMVSDTMLDARRARQVLTQVVDPEIPSVTIEELGILRDVAVADGRVVVDLTPTYSGCPAMDLIRRQVRDALVAAGFGEVEVRTVYAPAWSTDDITDEGLRKLAASGIAPPRRVADADRPVLCPRCATDRTRTVAEFGSTACKALMVCDGCGEPFHRFKEL